jgi:glycosyltransferase involved in cell wall biosynthesis
MPKISVVIPVYNNQETLERCLSAIKQSAYQDYEIVVADSGSRDETVAIAGRFTNKIISLRENKGRGYSRAQGANAATGGIIVNVDSDILVNPDTLSLIDAYFQQHPEVDALTGLLAKEHPYRKFFSQYKNLYMHYMYRSLPERVTFLYGSVYAFRKGQLQPYDGDIQTADDTALGQRFVAAGKQIAFLRSLEVIHLKRHNFCSFIQNDFRIPFDWAQIFLKYNGWKQLFRGKTGYAHAPKGQIISLLLASCISVVSVVYVAKGVFSLFPIVLLFVWFLLNLRFFSFLAKEKGFAFGVLAVFVTFLDHMVMTFGIMGGVIRSLFRV